MFSHHCLLQVATKKCCVNESLTGDTLAVLLQVLVIKFADEISERCVRPEPGELQQESAERRILPVSPIT